ncbi:MAG: hypothetical protein JWR71_1543 [Pseudarthrobacter sp.]|nr:hypothetical protein [Pseudarthrobacter sp.]
MTPGDAGGHRIGRVTRNCRRAVWRCGVPKRLTALKRQMKKNAFGLSRYCRFSTTQWTVQGLLAGNFPDGLRERSGKSHIN